MRPVLLAQLRANAARLVASTLAVVIAVGFVAATLVLDETARSTALRAVGAEYVDTAVVVTSPDGAPLDGAVATVAALPGVRAVAPALDTSVQTVLPGRTGAQYLWVTAVADDPALQWQQLSAGTLPTGPGQVAVSAQDGLAVGAVLPVTVYSTDGTTTTDEAVVTGIVDLAGGFGSGAYARGFVTAEQAVAWGAHQPVELRIAAWPRTDPAALAVLVRDALPVPGLVVLTGTEAAEATFTAVIGDADALTTVLLAFGAVAVLVAGLVIANTFAVLLAQRTRELALLRCVGATSRQVRRSVLAEALATGVAASVLGVLAGVGLAAAMSALADIADLAVPLAELSVPWTAVVTGLVVGTGVTVVAALAPALAATRVAPLAALRPVDPAPVRSRAGALRLGVGLLFLVPGVVLLVQGAVVGDVLIALSGGALSFLGVVLLAQRAVPPVVAAAGRLAGRLGGVPARLASGNATRNPRRTAATATALLIGVTLTTAMVVGASSTRATATADLDAAYPTDVVVDGAGDGVPLPESLLAGLRAVDGVADGVPLTAAEVTGPDGQTMVALGFDTAATLPVLRSVADQRLPQLGEAVLPEWLAVQWGVSDGSPVVLRAGERSLTMTAVLGGPDVDDVRLTSTELAALDPTADIRLMWLRLTDDADLSQVLGEIADRAGSAVPTAQVIGRAAERQSIEDVLDALLLVGTGLLGVAVVIAVIGVGNTLALSVVERRQESGLLRALGLTRAQLRGLLAWEAVLVAGVAAVLGVLLGGGYGLAGAASVLTAFGSTGGVVLDVPWLQVGAIVVVATVAGLLASVLPARRAARTSPVAALAT